MFKYKSVCLCMTSFSFTKSLIKAYVCSLGTQDSLNLYNIPSGISNINNGKNGHHVTEKTEEWPDWNECEELKPEKNTIADTKLKDFCVNSHPCLANHDGGEKSPFKLSSGNTHYDRGINDIAELPPFAPQKELRTLRNNPLPESISNNDGCDPRDQDQKSSLTKTSFPEKSPKLKSGLGEEFVIQVKRKELRDTELDWFADMVPDIKSSLLVLPELEAQSFIQSNSETVLGSMSDGQEMPFSSKFAASEIAEVRI